MKYLVNGLEIAYTAEGETEFGEKVVLSKTADDLTAKTAWAGNGFTIERLYPSPIIEEFMGGACSLLRQLWKDSGMDVSSVENLSDYHHIAVDQSIHLRAVEKTKLISVSRFPLGIRKLEERISEICGMPLRVHNPFDDEEIFHFRVIRPNNGDNNPLHKDVWLSDYSNCINLYIPIAGSNEKSSLILAPGSHLWDEHVVERTVEGAVINGQKFNVPAVTRISHEVDWLRPDPKTGEVLIFSPYLIHGGSVNLNPNATRISLEVRLWRT